MIVYKNGWQKDIDTTTKSGTITLPDGEYTNLENEIFPADDRDRIEFTSTTNTTFYNNGSKTIYTKDDNFFYLYLDANDDNTK